MIMNKAGGAGSKPTFWSTDDHTEITGGYLVDKLTFPEQIEGTPLNTTLNLQKTNNLRDMLSYVKSIVIPERFTTVVYDLAASVYPNWEELEIKGATAITIANLKNCKYLKRLKWDKWTGDLQGFGWNFLNNATVGQESVSTELEIDCPKTTRFGPGNVGMSGHTVNLKLNLPSVTDIGSPGTSYNCLRYATGTWVFPACTKIGYFARPSVEQTLKLPAIETIYEPFTYGESGVTGKLHLYIGPNATSSYTSWMTAINSYPQLFDVHIPPGTDHSTYTLCHNNIPYTADYTDWQSDLNLEV